MRRWLWVLVTVLILAGVAVGAWCYGYREQLARHLACYRVGAAESFEQAQVEIAWFENGPDREAQLSELVRNWGTGNQQFDVYLARHISDPACSDLLRKTFSREVGRREELLPRWAHYWSYQARQGPDQQIASILAYLDMLAAVEPSKPITWREVLDLQAVFELTGQARLAEGLSPLNWQDEYRRWQKDRPAELPPIERPRDPLPDWQAPVGK